MADALQEPVCHSNPRRRPLPRLMHRDACTARLALPRQPRPKSPQHLKWSRSGGPVAARKSAGRVTIATVSAITTVRRKARTPQPLSRVKPATPPRASGIAADVATATDFRKPRTDAPPADGVTPAVAADGAPASPPREDRAAGRRASVFKARAGTTTGRSRQTSRQAAG